MCTCNNSIVVALAVAVAVAVVVVGVLNELHYINETMISLD